MALTPSFDASTRQLVNYLRDRLNDDSQAIDGRDAVVSVRDHDSDLNAVPAFPLLRLFRSSYSGIRFEIAELTIEYFLYSPSEYEAQPGIFNWVIRKIGEYLADWADGAEPVQCLELTIPDGATASVQWAEVNGRFLPFVRITIPGVRDLE